VTGHPRRVRVATDPGYDVLVGSGVRAAVVDMLPDSVSRVAVVHTATVADTAVGVASSLQQTGREVLPLVVPDGERAKTTAVVDELWSTLGTAGFTRSDAVVSVGGGAVTDVAGFAAATYLRGVAVLHVPTTLLAMVDAAVGGKTGINTTSGKNLVGAFHQPRGVLCDLDLLRTLDRRDIAAGLAEVVKCGFVADPGILSLVEGDPVASTDPSSEVLATLVERAVGVKAAVVSADEREATSRGSRVGREMLNYGHTLGHAIERTEGYAIRHGEAVAVGMVYAAELGCRGGALPAVVVERHRTVLAAVGLPVSYPAGHWPALLAAMRVDKKARGHTLRFVVLDDIAKPTILAAPREELLREAYTAVSGR
jgi:3-dehydroquinate synthase